MRALRPSGARAGAALLLAVGLAAGSPSAAAHRGRDAQTAEEQRQEQVMAVLKPSPPTLWNRDARALAQAYEAELVVAWTLRSLDAPCIILEPRSGRSLEAVVASLSADHRVQWAQPVQYFSLLTEYNDPHYHLQHGAHALDLGQAHAHATGRDVTVAIVDTGVDVAHPDLRDRVAGAQSLLERDRGGFTGDVHGTAVAGVIAAQANNEVGIVGVAPDARLLALTACWPVGDAGGAACNSYTLAGALDAAIHRRAEVINLSLTGPRDRLVETLILEAVARGTTVVAAADEGSADGGFPASLPAVLGVGAAGAGEAEPVAAAGRVLAPGEDILTTVPRGAYDFLSGSSLAAAHASGVVALLVQCRPGTAPAELLRIVVETARRDPAAARPGTIDAAAALGRLTVSGPCASR